jgi:8-hydroxy-5-deazaflavin:NADPH oxidoreductase
VDLRSRGVRIGIVGSGNLGRALGGRLSVAGHELMFASDVSAAEAASQLEGAQSGTNEEAARFGDVVILSVAWAAVPSALEDAGSLDGKILWSCVNPLKPDLSGLAIGFHTSAAETVARLVPDARVVSAIPPFAEAIASGDLHYESDLTPSVFVCGNDDEAKRTIESLIADLGADPIDAGSLEAARLIEPAMMLLVRIAYAGLPRDVGLRLLERTQTS